MTKFRKKYVKINLRKSEPRVYFIPAQSAKSGLQKTINIQEVFTMGALDYLKALGNLAASGLVSLSDKINEYEKAYELWDDKSLMKEHLFVGMKMENAQFGTSDMIEYGAKYEAIHRIMERRGHLK